MNRQIGISFGALSPKLSAQLRQQNFKFDKEKIKIYEMEIDALTRLRFGSGLLTDSMFDKLIKKLYNKIVSHVAARNGLKVNNPKSK